MTERILQFNDEILGNHAEKRIFYFLLFGVGVTALIYVYLIGSIVYGAVVKENIEIDIRNLQPEIGVLEIKYLDLSSKITPEFAHNLGFNEVKAQVFAPRISLGEALSLRVNEN